MKDGISILSFTNVPERDFTDAMIEDDTSILSTTYRPTIAEAELIKLRCIKGHSELEEIDKRLKELTHRKKHLIQACATGSALLAPIRKLQPKLLAEIFSHCIPAFSFPNDEDKSINFKMIGLYASTSPHFVRKLLGGVCKWWKMVLDDTPRLWTTLTLLNVLDNFQEIEEGLEMSENAPLDIYICNAVRGRHEDMYGFDITYTIEAAFVQLREASPRIRNIDAVISKTHGGLSSLFPSYSLTSAPALESLCIAQDYGLTMTTFPGVSISAPKLHTVKLEFTPGDLLKSFTDDTLENLRCLCLKSKDLSEETYFPLFSHCSQLEHLNWRVYGTTIDISSSGVEIVTLPSLKTLIYGFNSQAGSIVSLSLLKHIRTPNITSLDIDASVEDTEITETIVAMFHYSLENLKHLHLRTVKVGAGFSALLPNLTGLRSLTLGDMSSCDDTLFDLFCPNDPDTPPACGSIEKLEFDNSKFPMGSMISFIYRSVQPGRKLHDKVYPVQVNYYYNSDPAMVHFSTTHSDIIKYRDGFEFGSGHSGSGWLNSTGHREEDVLTIDGWNNFKRHRTVNPDWAWGY